MWAETKARSSRAKVKVFFNSPPTPSTTGPAGGGSVTGIGAKPRERRIGKVLVPTARSTESSTGT